MLTLDVRDRRAAFDVVAQVEAESGGVDVLVNNAGYGLIGAIEEVSESDARAIVDTDLSGPLWLSQAVLPGMRARAAGTIVQISTVGAVGTMPTLGLYNAAKWGFEAFSEAMAAEVEGAGIRVLIVEPGGLDTEWGTGSMRFAAPNPAYDGLRESLFGTAEVPWPAEGTAGGASPADAAAAILRIVAEDPTGLRHLVGDDAPSQVATAIGMRLADYRRDPRFVAAETDIDASAGQT
ncbi:SDR family NAD(P)-dependent oxidoreductase [Herbiconiux sp. L3-i23]|uniref:SDR family NAD(P)-dependent oxidoreductase n=1 Tax=Herbiconiux sp. L3-i23 TaxID=2905871 RepID=UPI002054D5C4|nr:SDR family NAD(P)-dependent oxidoreductase [Herbiconiux sp. L3-i23]BDI23172.1 hypothetical protein L3i23_19480 [Herbiconiux sp. L3-i23]